MENKSSILLIFICCFTSVLCGCCGFMSCYQRDNTEDNIRKMIFNGNFYRFQQFSLNAETGNLTSGLVVNRGGFCTVKGNSEEFLTINNKTKTAYLGRGTETDDDVIQVQLCNKKHNEETGKFIYDDDIRNTIIIQGYEE